MARGTTEAAPPEGPPKNIRFIDSMPRALLAVFLVLAIAGIALVVVVFVHPPKPKEIALGLRRSPPAGAFSHDVLLKRLVAIPSTLPAYTPPRNCDVDGVLIEGGVPARDRIDSVLRPLCAAELQSTNPQFHEAMKALATARIRFALFTRTGNLSTADFGARRVLLAIGLSRENVPAGELAPLIVHEAYHLSQALPFTAEQEYEARVAEYAACVALPGFDAKHFPRDCADARDIIRLGRAGAVALLVSAGYPR